jgi:hypothetical protein
MNVNRIQDHDIIPQIAVMFEKYPKAFPADPLEPAIKEMRANSAPIVTATQGSPSLLTLPITSGAWPRQYRPYSVRDDTNRSAQPADQALVSNTALMIEGNIGIPAFLIAITKGLFAAVDFRFSDGSAGETRMPMMKALQR